MNYETRHFSMKEKRVIRKKSNKFCLLKTKSQSKNFNKLTKETNVLI
jgi:hypothetical protein